MTICSKKLPCFTFVTKNSAANSIDLSDRSGQIIACAEALKGRAEVGAIIGLCFRTGPDLVFWWLGAILAGFRPLILQYPTGKQARSYWQSSIEDTIDRADLTAIIADDAVAQVLSGNHSAFVINQPLPDAVENSTFVLDDFSIIQLSSGTTGFRKAVEFTAGQLHDHVEDFNATLELTEDDTIVSWLPLYHDMGYIACFVMPLILGVPVVMMDPEDWVEDKGLLFSTIEKHRGTVCYMPNFGFEVMSGCEVGDVSSMRFWISCSEPVFESTARKFMKHVGQPEDRFAACYAMAENVFAMTQSTGIRVARLDDEDVVSCGPPIRNVEIKTVDGELWVRSRASITSYMSKESIVDDEGFYPTGDMGHIVDGEIYVTGRKRDLMIQAGKKYYLSTVDAAVNRLVPEARGRVATLEDYDERLATSKAVVLIEAQDFFTRAGHNEIKEKILDDCGLDHVEINFVPPRFLTKTSSGKINRVLSLKHWKQVQDAKGVSLKTDPASDIHREFATLPFDKPAKHVLDSLSETVLRIILSDTGVPFESEWTLNDYLEAVGQNNGQDTEKDQAIRVASLADRRLMRFLKQEHLDEIGLAVGHSIEVEHLCCPPTPILLSDLIFVDYFLPRIEDKEPFTHLVRSVNKLRSSSLVLIDDTAELFFSLSQVYPVLSHRLERTREADLVGLRWQSYARGHDKLPVAVVAGVWIDVEDRAKTIDMLAQYLGIPIYKIATLTSLQEYTRDWDLIELQSLASPGLKPLAPDRIQSFLEGRIRDTRGGVRLVDAQQGDALRLNDLPHFCAQYVDRQNLDLVLEEFESFCIAGSPSSVTYIPKKLDELAKPYFFVASPNKETLEAATDFDCLLMCGPTVRVDIDAPTAFVMGTVEGTGTKNCEEHPEIKDVSFWARNCLVHTSDWYSLSEPVNQSELASQLEAARLDAVEARDQRLAEQAKRREARQERLRNRLFSN
ncbi:AMP-binding protein [Maritimibacter dapengensis]|uniref:AMP-binding protein n=1 Tax=Maritimibacter dapengensis TaxID=2836868 RepID=A0ABS6T3A9_9RHOB|nr:AMP-binding protein [Maritimibacter dapengensis]MBV7379685.1 AMP-binding protein [Maritimibacter dapengensis]